MTLEASLNAVHAAGLRLVVAGEDDKGVWLATVATSRLANLKTWKTGRGSSLEAAITNALKKPIKPKLPEGKPRNDFEDLV